MDPFDTAVRAGAPNVNFLTARFYLFDAIGMLGKIQRPSPMPLPRAAVRIIAATHGVGAAAMRAS